MAKDKSLIFDDATDSDFQSGQNHLLLIAIDRYKHDIADLDNAVRDAEAFRDLLLDKYQFDGKHLEEVYNDQATQRGITQTLRKYTQSKKIKANDSLLIYFSGHGHYDKTLKDAYWVPNDAEFEAETDYISYDYLRRVLMAIPAHHILMIVDSCYSGAALVRKKDIAAKRVEKDPSRWLIASGRNEVVPDGEPGTHSPFANHLLDLLSRNAAKGLPVGTLANQLTRNVSYNSPQTPIGRPIYGVGDKGGEFVFRPRSIQAKLSTQSSENEAWQVAKEANTILGYLDFIDENGGSKYISTAQKYIRQLANKRSGKITLQPESVPPKKESSQPKSSPIEMVFVEGGTFMMGSKKNDDEKPIHKVTVPSFEIGKYPVTQKQWKDIMGDNPSHFKHSLDCPVEQVSWDAAQEFLKKLNAKYPGMNYVFPSEAQWEFAARGGNLSQGFTYSGSNDANHVAWYIDNSNKQTHPVGEKKPNELDIFDMSGNVWEWCQDKWHKDYSKAPDDGSAWESGAGTYRVVRGGSWYGLSTGLRVANRNYDNPDDRNYGIGFRLTRSLP